MNQLGLPLTVISWERIASFARSAVNLLERFRVAASPGLSDAEMTYFPDPKR